MKKFFWALAASLVAGCFGGPANAADLKILEPADKSIVKGSVLFRIAPQDEPTDVFLANPELSVQDEYGKELRHLRAIRDPRTQVCAALLDTSHMPDGIYLVSITYKTLFQGKSLRKFREDMTLSVRNSTIQPAKFTVDAPTADLHAGDSADFTVHVLDARGHKMSGARVEFTVDKGEVNTPAEICDGSGEATVSVDSDDPQTVTVTIKVEGLPPVTKTVKFLP